MLLPGILVLDPASRRRVLLPPPPRDALLGDQQHQTRLIIGAAVLSRAHPSKLSFEVVCITLDEGRPRAWVACVHGDGCIWRALPRSEHAMDQIEPVSFCKGCVRDEGKVYWRFCNSRRLLALDSRSLEMSLVLAPAKPGRHFNGDRHTLFGMSNDKLIFPYSLCWPPEFLSTPKGDPLTENIMKLVRIAVYNISYIRSVFKKEFFCDTSTTHTGMKIKQLKPMDEESIRLIDWIDKGVYHALQKRYLRSILFGIFEEGGPVIEEYCLSFNFEEDVTMALQLTGCTESIWTLTSNAESFPSQMWSSAVTMLENLLSVLSTHKQIPEERFIMMRLLYFDDTTPPDYEPPFFKCCDDEMRKQITQTRHSPFKDISMKDTEVPRGYLYCMTKKKIIFYFDSGASCHMCGDKKMIENLHEVSVENRVPVFDAEGKEMLLGEAGEIAYGQIRLSPVF
ncbi:unnamed protein product [Urochloa humidicola]